MKKNILAIICTICCVMSANAQKSNMIFFTQNEEKFYIVINGVQQNNKPLSNVKISGMAAPMQYTVRVKFEKGKTIIDDKITLQPSIEKTWIIQPKNGGYAIKYSGFTELSNDNLEKMMMPNQEEIIYQPQTNIKVNEDGFSMSVHTGEESANVSISASGMNTTINTNATNSNRDLGDSEMQAQPRKNRNIPCNNTINNLDFRNEINRVSSQTSNAGKKLVAEKIAKAYCLTSLQVYALCNSLNFSNDKLDIAKFCYTNCTDPENYEEVYKCFAISATVRELDEYITRLGFQTTHHPIRQNPVIRDDEFVPGYNGVKGCFRPMNASNFGDAKNTIAEASFENTKFTTAKTILGSNCVTVSQVIEICKLFDFENTKLDFAKFAYPKTYDKANYYKVAVVFEFDATKETLNRFIQNGRN